MFVAFRNTKLLIKFLYFSFACVPTGVANKKERKMENPLLVIATSKLNFVHMSRAGDQWGLWKFGCSCCQERFQGFVYLNNKCYGGIYLPSKININLSNKFLVQTISLD